MLFTSNRCNYPPSWVIHFSHIHFTSNMCNLLYTSVIYIQVVQLTRTLALQSLLCNSLQTCAIILWVEQFYFSHVHFTYMCNSLYTCAIFTQFVQPTRPLVCNSTTAYQCTICTECLSCAEIKTRYLLRLIFVGCAIHQEATHAAPPTKPSN